MPRRPRGSTGASTHHVWNRAVRRAVLFDTPEDYERFELVLTQAMQRVPVQLLAYCAMPNHWHLIVWADKITELSRFMHWLDDDPRATLARTARNGRDGARLSGRFKGVPIESDAHLLTACRYVERNALSGGLVARAEDWRWSSVWRRCNHREDKILHAWPIPAPSDWLESLNQR